MGSEGGKAAAHRPEEEEQEREMMRKCHAESGPSHAQFTHRTRGAAPAPKSALSTTDT